MKPNTNSGMALVPEATRMRYRDAWRLNLWAMVAVAAAWGSRLALKSPGLAGTGRVAMALLPMVPVLLYLRTVRRWIRTLDELQQRIQWEALTFGAMGMLAIALAADLLRTAGYVHGMNFGWEGFFAFTFVLWMIGNLLALRRYQ